MINLSWIRTFSIFSKEFVKISRDPAIIIAIISMPLIQIILFGYAINVFPKHLPTAVISYDNSHLTRRLIKGISDTSYFNLEYFPKTEAAANELIRDGKVSFVINIPANFTHELIRGNHPHILLETDGSVPGGTGNAIEAIQSLSQSVFDRDFQGPLSYLSSTNSSSFIIDNQTKYNAGLKATHAVLPGIIGTVLTFTLLVLSAMTITDEKESGTIEVLLNSPIQPIEIMIGKFLSYLLLGYIILISTVLLSTKILFDVPMEGSLLTLAIASLPFIVSNLMLGIAASTVAKTALEAQQYVSFFILPSIMLSGFTFPFHGMPHWARMIGNALPLTHYIRIVSGIMLKGFSWTDILSELIPIFLFFLVSLFVALFAFRKKLG